MDVVLNDLVPVKAVEGEGLRRFMSKRVPGFPHAKDIYPAVKEAVR